MTPPAVRPSVSTAPRSLANLPGEYRKLAMQALLFAALAVVTIVATLTLEYRPWFFSLAPPIEIGACVVGIFVTAWSIALTIWKITPAILYLRNGAPSATSVSHWTSKTIKAIIDKDGEIKPGSAATNLGAAVYVSGPNYPKATNTVSCNFRFPFVHFVAIGNIVAIPIIVDNPERLIWCSKKTFAVRGSVLRVGNDFRI